MKEIIGFKGEVEFSQDKFTLDRRSLIKSVGVAGLGALLGSRSSRANATITSNQQFYFDSAGDDSNSGTSASSPWKGMTTNQRIRDIISSAEISGASNITINIARGSVYNSNRTIWGGFGPGILSSIGVNGLTIQSYGNPDLPAPLFDCTYSLPNDQSWARVANSNVWRFPTGWSANTSSPQSNLRIQRLWLGGSRVEMEDLPIRIIVGGAPKVNGVYILPTEAQICAALTGQTNVSIDGDCWDTFWYAGPSVEDPNHIYLYVYSGSATLNPVAAYGAVYLSMEDYGYFGVRLNNCQNFHVTDLEIWGGNTKWMLIEGGSGIIERVNCRYGNLIGSGGLHISGNTYAGGEFSITDVVLNNDLTNSKFFISGVNIDAAGNRGETNDLLVMNGSIKKVTITGGEIHDACHAGVSCPQVTPNNGFQLSISGTKFFQSNVRYGRALNINGQMNCFNSISITNITVTGQATASQLSGQNISFVGNTFTSGRQSVGAAKSKYSGAMINKNGTAGQFCLCNLPTTDGTDSDYTDNVWIENCIFKDGYDWSIGYYNYSTNPARYITNNVNFWNCTFSNTQGYSTKLIDSNRTPGSSAIQMYLSNCKSYGYSTAMCCDSVTAAPVSVNLPTTSPYTGSIDTLNLQNHQMLTSSPV